MVKGTLAGLLSVSLLACSSAAPSVGASTPDPDPGAVVTDLPHPGPSDDGIVKIQTRDRNVTLHVADHGVRRFTVQDAQGRVLANKVELGALEGIDARAYDLVRSTVATGTARAELGN